MLSRKLALEELHERTLPSATLPHPHQPTSPVVHVHTGDESETGKGKADYTVSSSSTSGDTYTLTGSIKLHKEGSFSVTGTIDVTGTSHATGSLVLTDSEGTIDVSLRGTSASSADKAPTSFRYIITGGTGAYSDMTGAGEVHTRFVPASTGSEDGTVHLRFT